MGEFVAITTIESDECSFTKPILSFVFPRAKQQQFKRKQGSIAGQGELNTVLRDALWGLLKNAWIKAFEPILPALTERE